MNLAKRLPAIITLLLASALGATLQAQTPVEKRTASEAKKTVAKAGDQPPTPRMMTRPTYPGKRRAAKKSGIVLIDFTIETDGRVQRAGAAWSSDRGFEAEAVKAVSKWRFEPAIIDGRKTATPMQVPIVFQFGDLRVPLNEAAKAVPEGVYRMSEFVVSVR
ncbi:MAG: energy transducer TonB [Verrucomicrobiota bacterium]